MAAAQQLAERRDPASGQVGARGLRAVEPNVQRDARPRVSFGRLVSLLDYANLQSPDSRDVTQMSYVADRKGEDLLRRVMGVTQTGHAFHLNREMVRRELDTPSGGFVAFLVGGTRDEMVVYGDSCLGVHHSEVAVSAVGTAGTRPVVGMDPLTVPPVNAFGATGRAFVRGVRTDSTEVYLHVPTGMEAMDSGQRFTPWRVALEHALGGVVR